MKTHSLDLNDYQTFVTEYHGESDRSAIVMAGSFVEHYLATYIRHFMVSDEEVERLFEFGPLSSFAARINIAHGFGLISNEHRHDLNIIKDIRNRFAHSPRLISLQKDEVRKEIRKLSMWTTLNGDRHMSSAEKDERHIFLFSVGMFVLFAHDQMTKKRKPNHAAQTTPGLRPSVSDL